MFLLRKQLHLSDEIQKSLEEFCLFCSLVYVKYWLLCALFRDAAINDLEFCKNVKLYEQVNEKMAKCALTKFSGQSWYLGPELAVFALFSDKVTDREKVDMIMKMKKSDGHWKRSLIPDTSDIDQKNITDFINSRSLFSIHKINPDVFKFMLHNHPSVWKSDPDFRKVIISFIC